VALDANALAAKFAARTKSKEAPKPLTQPYVKPQRANGAPSSPARKPPDRDKTAPHSSEAERGVLGSMLVNPGEAITEARRHTNQFHYYIPAHRTVFEALSDMWDSGVSVDLITFTQFLRDRGKLDEVGGAGFVTGLFTFVPTAANILYYIDIVKEKFVQREMISLGSQMVRAAHGEIDNDAMELVEGFSQKLERIKYAAGGRNGSEKFEISALRSFDAQHDPDCLIGRRYMVRGGNCLWAGGSGYGKSSLMMQIVVYLATGTPIYGLKSFRPLKQLIIQAENDEGDMSEQLNGVFGGIQKLGEIDLDGKAAQIEKNIGIHRVIGKSGNDFLSLLDSLLEIDCPDMVWLDPLLAFAGCDLLNSERTGRFLREGLFPIFAKRRVFGNVIHHVGKPQRDGEDHPTSTIDLQYLGFGTSEIQNSFRAVNILMPVKGTPDLYRLAFTKRGERANVRNPEGEWTRDIYIKHAAQADGICWLQTDKPDDDAKSGRPKTFVLADLLAEMSAIHPIKTAALQKKMYEEHNTSRATFFRLLEAGKKEKRIVWSGEGWISKKPALDLSPDSSQ
jgi:hypothetical protein